MKKKILIPYYKISLLDCYIAQQILPSFIFNVAVCSIISEVIGISFEQAKFAIEEELPVTIVMYIHWLKLPYFISLALPFSLLIASISVYTKLSNKNETIAMQSFGISLYRQIISSLVIACIATMIVFTFHELVVPDTNYKAAMILEQEWNVDRTKLSKYNKKEIIYQEFEKNKYEKKLKMLFFADRLINKEMKEVTIIKYENQKIKQIIVARSAKWKEQQQKWQLLSGSFYMLNKQGIYIQSYDFEQMYLELNNNILNYVSHQRDNREMNIVDLYRRLAVVKNTNNIKQIRALEISIQERYAEAFSCIIFTFLGSVLGVNSRMKANHSSFGIALIIIFIYYSTKLFSITLAASKVISVFWGVWLPNLLGLIVGYLILKRT